MNLGSINRNICDNGYSHLKLDLQFDHMSLLSSKIITINALGEQYIPFSSECQPKGHKSFNIHRRKQVNIEQLTS